MSGMAVIRLEWSLCTAPALKWFRRRIYLRHIPTHLSIRFIFATPYCGTAPRLPEHSRAIASLHDIYSMDGTVGWASGTEEPC